MEHKRFFVVISGPTGVGKTDIVNKLCDYIDYPIEVINADMGQFYESISIGTAKPDWKAEKCPQHLFDIVKDPINFTTFDYVEKVKNLLNDLWDRGKLPIIVGGSSFYINSLFFSQILDKSHNSHKELNLNFNKNVEINAFKTNEELWNELCLIDSVRANKIHVNDRYRIERALALWYKTGQLPSSQLPKFNFLGNFFVIFLTRDRKELYNRIDRRVIEMINQGWIQEVKELDSSWRNFLKNKNIIGYPEIIKFIDSIISNEELELKLVNDIQKKTRNYAKRQITFWNSFSKKLKNSLKDCNINNSKIEEINLSDKDNDFIAKHLSLKIEREISKLS